MPGLVPPATSIAPGEVVQPRVPARLYALKDADTFAVCDAFGDITGDADGFFHNDTRILSFYRLTIGDAPPSLLSAAISRDSVFFTAHLTNRPLPPLGGRSVPQGVIHIERDRFLWHERLFERVSCKNYGQAEVVLPLRFDFLADFRDMFEVRGKVRQSRGRLAAPEILERQVSFIYEGLDRVQRSTTIAFSEAPNDLRGGHANFDIHLSAEGAHEIYIEIGTKQAGEPCRRRFRDCAATARRAMRRRFRLGARLRSSGRVFNEWIEKSRADIALLITEQPTGPYPYAGIPWFSTAFGRDAIITALQMLWIEPSLAEGVLRFLAQHQAQETSPFQDAEPGKIMHETRKGEMTTLRELPFGLYYGGVDTTPLFVMLAVAHAERTGSIALIDALWPQLTAAIRWIETASPNGLLTYRNHTGGGLVNQGWKDSDDSIFHRDGHFAGGSIALLEVQGYVFAALQGMMGLAARRGEHELADRWCERAEKLRKLVEKVFWSESLGFYGIALDGDGALCEVRASNAGHLLYTGLAHPDRAARVSQQLLSSAFDTGWGLRTLAAGETRFNPMSYHNGSVWPHDTAICAAGLGRYGERVGLVRLTNEMFEAAVRFDMRLPELFCGFPRAPSEPPIAYPVACVPQAWAAGSLFMILQALLGIRIDGWRREIHIDRPLLPIGIDSLEIHGLAVGADNVDLVFQRIGERVVAFSKDGRSSVPLILHL